MLTNSEDVPFPESDPFAYGDQTVVQLRSQSFDVEDERGTVVTMPIGTDPRLTVAAPAPEVFVDEEPLVRLERKLDLALRQITALQQQLDSLDVTLARVLSRA
jgi:hypothetical protein